MDRGIIDGAAQPVAIIYDFSGTTGGVAASVAVSDGTDTAQITGSGDLQVSVQNQPTVTVDSSTPIDVNITNASIDVNTTVTVGAVQISDGVETANVDTSNRLEVAVLNQPIVLIDDSTPVDISITNIPHVVIDSGTITTSISGTPAVTLSGTSNLIRLTDGVETAAVDVNNRLEVAVGSLPNVTIASLPNVVIDDSTPIDVTLTNSAILVTIPSTTQLKIWDGTEIASVDTSNRLEVAVANIPAVTINGQVSVNDSVPIDVAVTNSLTVAISGTPTVNIGTLPAVLINDTTAVRVNLTNASVTAVISGTPNVSITNQPTVTVDDSTPISTTIPNTTQIKIWDGSETASINTLNQLEVAVANSPTVVINDTTPIDVNVTNASIDVNTTVTIDAVKITDGVENANITPSNQLEVAVTNTPSFKITDGVELVNVNTNNQLEVAVLNQPTVTIDDSTPIEVNASVTINEVKIWDGVESVNVNASNQLEVSVGNIPHTIVDSGSITATISGTPNVAVASLPLVVIDDSTPIEVNASVTINEVKIWDGIETASVDANNRLEVSVGNIPHTIVDSGAITATISGTPNVAVTSLPLVVIDDSTPIEVNASVTINEIKIWDGVETASVDASNRLEVSVGNVPHAIIDSGAISATISGTPAVTLSGTANSIRLTDGVETVSVDANSRLEVAIGNIPHTIVDSGAITATISGTPNVAITNVPAVTVNSGAITATISGTPNVAVTSLPNVVIDDTTPIDINITNSSIAIPNTTQVKLWDGVETASINASNQLEVSVGNTPNVVVTSLPLVVIDDSTPIEVNASVTINEIKIWDGTETASVDVNNRLEVSVGNVPNVVVNSGSITATISGTPNIAITNQPTVTVDDTTPIDVNLTGTSSVRITDGVETANINALNQLEVSVENIPDVVVTSLPNVVIDDSTPIDINVTNGSIATTLPNTTQVRIFDGTETASVDASNRLEVAVGNIPHIILDSGAVTATISGTPSVTLSGTANSIRLTDGVETASVDASNRLEVSVGNVAHNIIDSGAITATISGTPNVVVTSLPSVVIDDTTPIDVALTGSSVVQITDGVETVNVNASNQLEVAIGNIPHAIIDSGAVTATISGTPNVAVTSLPSIIVDDTIPVDVNLTNSSIGVTVPNTTTIKLWDGTETVSVDTSNRLEVAIGNIPHIILDSGAVTATISGTPNVAITNVPAVTINSGSVTATISGTPNVAVTNVPHVILDSGSVTATISGTPAVTLSGTANSIRLTDGVETASVDSSNRLEVAVNNIPHAIIDSGAITATISGTPNVAVTNIPHTIVDSGAITATISGTPNVNISSVTLPTVITTNQVNVTTAGTQVQMSGSSVVLKSGVTIKAKGTNTGLIYVGITGVSSTTGYILGSSESVFLEIDNLNRVYLNSSVNGEGISYIAT